jgi:hypothetical protein
VCLPLLDDVGHDRRLTHRRVALAFVVVAPVGAHVAEIWREVREAGVVAEVPLLAELARRATTTHASYAPASGFPPRRQGVAVTPRISDSGNTRGSSTTSPRSRGELRRRSRAAPAVPCDARGSARWRSAPARTACAVPGEYVPEVDPELLEPVRRLRGELSAMHEDHDGRSQRRREVSRGVSEQSGFTEPVGETASTDRAPSAHALKIFARPLRWYGRSV